MSKNKDFQDEGIDSFLTDNDGPPALSFTDEDIPSEDEISSMDLTGAFPSEGPGEGEWGGFPSPEEEPEDEPIDSFIMGGPDEAEPTADSEDEDPEEAPEEEDPEFPEDGDGDADDEENEGRYHEGDDDGDGYEDGDEFTDEPPPSKSYAKLAIYGLIASVVVGVAYIGAQQFAPGLFGGRSDEPQIQFAPKPDPSLPTPPEGAASGPVGAPPLPGLGDLPQFGKGSLASGILQDGRPPVSGEPLSVDSEEAGNTGLLQLDGSQPDRQGLPRGIDDNLSGDMVSLPSSQPAPGAMPPVAPPPVAPPADAGPVNALEKRLEALEEKLRGLSATPASNEPHPALEEIAGRLSVLDVFARRLEMLEQRLEASLAENRRLSERLEKVLASPIATAETAPADATAAPVAEAPKPATGPAQPSAPAAPAQTAEADKPKPSPRPAAGDAPKADAPKAPAPAARAAGDKPRPTRLADGRTRGQSVNIPQRPNILRGMRLTGVASGEAWIETAAGVTRVAVGQPVPGMGTIRSIEMADGNWVVITSEGMIIP